MRAAWLATLAVVAGVLLGTPAPSHATTYTAATCAFTDVATVAQSSPETPNNAALVDGDTVIIPNGSCTWATQLVIRKGITLKGQNLCTLGTVTGITNLPTSCPTVITDNVTKDGSPNSSLIRWLTDKYFEMSHFAITDQAADTSFFNKGHISGISKSSTFRFHHLKIDLTLVNSSDKNTFFRVGGCLYGLMDHINYHADFKDLANVEHDACFNNTTGDGSWANALTPGDSGAFYVEDSSLVGTSGSFIVNMFDGFLGLRGVIRNNALSDANTTSHGTDSGPTAGTRTRSVRWVEVYSNTYTCPNSGAVAFVHWFRGGSGVMYNNTVTCATINNLAQHANCRDSGAGCGGAGAGGNAFQPFGAAGQVTVNTLTQTGGTATATITAGHGYLSGNSYYVTISGASPAGYNGTVLMTASSTTQFTYSVSPSLAGSATGTLVMTSPYDGNTNSSGYRATDQPGAGTSVDFAGVVIPANFPTANILEPIYVWNNTINGVVNNCDSGGGGGCASVGNVIAGQDIIFGSVRPNYTACVYPHPLQTGGGPCLGTVPPVFHHIPTIMTALSITMIFLSTWLWGIYGTERRTTAPVHLLLSRSDSITSPVKRTLELVPFQNPSNSTTTGYGKEKGYYYRKVGNEIKSSVSSGVPVPYSVAMEKKENDPTSVDV